MSDAEDKSTVTMLEVLTEERTMDEAIQHVGACDIVPSSMFLASIDGRLTNSLARPFRLQKAISEMKHQYDFIFIDTPPALGTLTNNALIAAESVVITAQADILSLQGVSQIYETIKAAREHANPSLRIEGICLTRYNDRTRLTKEVSGLFETAAREMGTKLFATRIREGIAVKEAQAAREDLFTYDAKSNPAMDYRSLIEEIFGIKVK